MRCFAISGGQRLTYWGDSQMWVGLGWVVRTRCSVALLLLLCSCANSVQISGVSVCTRRFALEVIGWHQTRNARRLTLDVRRPTHDVQCFDEGRRMRKSMPRAAANVSIQLIRLFEISHYRVFLFFFGFLFRF